MEPPTVRAQLKEVLDAPALFNPAFGLAAMWLHLEDGDFWKAIEAAPIFEALGLVKLGLRLLPKGLTFAADAVPPGGAAKTVPTGSGGMDGNASKTEGVSGNAAKGEDAGQDGGLAARGHGGPIVEETWEHGKVAPHVLLAAKYRAWMVEQELRARNLNATASVREDGEVWALSDIQTGEILAAIRFKAGDFWKVSAVDRSGGMSEARLREAALLQLADGAAAKRSHAAGLASKVDAPVHGLHDPSSSPPIHTAPMAQHIAEATNIALLSMVGRVLDDESASPGRAQKLYSGIASSVIRQDHKRPPMQPAPPMWLTATADGRGLQGYIRSGRIKVCFEVPGQNVEALLTSLREFVARN